MCAQRAYHVLSTEPMRIAIGEDARRERAKPARVFRRRSRFAPARPYERPDRPTGFFICMDYSKLNGLIPAVIQDADSSEVLMVGFMNDEALARTRESGFATFFSRTRNALWMKGETSGNRLAVTEILVDCDEDTVLAKVKRQGDGNVGHTGERTCFYRKLDAQ